MATGILAGFIYRSPGGDTCILIVDGHRLLGTIFLRPLASSLTPVEEEDLDDLRKLRDRYCVFRRSLGLSTAADPRPATPINSPPIAPPAGELSLTVRGPRAGPAPAFSEVVRTLPTVVGDQLRTLLAEAIEQKVAVATRQALIRVGELEEAHRLHEVAARHQATAIAGLKAKQTEQGGSLLVLEATYETLRDDVTETRAALEVTGATVRDHTRDWTDLRIFLAQQTAQLTWIEERMEVNQSSIQSFFKRHGGDVDEEGRSSPPHQGPPHQANMSAHTTQERSEGTTPLTKTLALTVVGRQYDWLGSLTSIFGNNTSPFVTHHGDPRWVGTPPPAPPTVLCTIPGEPTPNTIQRHWLPTKRDSNPPTGVGSGPRPPTPPHRFTHPAFTKVPKEPLSAHGPPFRDHPSNSASPL